LPVPRNVKLRSSLVRHEHGAHCRLQVRSACRGLTNYRLALVSLEAHKRAVPNELSLSPPWNNGSACGAGRASSTGKLAAWIVTDERRSGRWRVRRRRQRDGQADDECRNGHACAENSEELVRATRVWAADQVNICCLSTRELCFHVCRPLFAVNVLDDLSSNEL